jgi:AcrR family transcriptional regulator
MAQTNYISMSVMGSKGQTNRRRIVEAANDLFYHRGFLQTSFSEVAEQSGIPKGNFYYYFKSKEELLKAVIAHRLTGLENMLREMEWGCTDPRSRLHRMAGVIQLNDKDIARYGCPVGSLNTELGKSQPEMQAGAREMFDLLCHWIERQFVDLGMGEASHSLALHMLAMLQGAALIGHAYSDQDFLHQEVKRIIAWIDTLLPLSPQ